MAEPETKLVMVDGRDALAYILIRPREDGTPGVAVDAGANGMSKAHAAAYMRQVADMWDPPSAGAGPGEQDTAEETP